MTDPIRGSGPGSTPGPEDQDNYDNHQRSAGLSKRLDNVLSRVVRLEAQTFCMRCRREPPPLERWPGDRRSLDARPPHSCGRPRWAR